MMDSSLNAIGLQSLSAGKLSALKSKAAATAQPSNASLSPELQERFQEVGQQFESMFLAEMLSHLNTGIDPNSQFGGGQGEEMFKSLLNEQYALEVAKRGGIGIAPAIENYLTMQQLASQEVKS